MNENVISAIKTMALGIVGVTTALSASFTWQDVDMVLTLLGKLAALGVSVLTFIKIYRGFKTKNKEDKGQ